MGYDCYVRHADPSTDPRPDVDWTVHAGDGSARTAYDEWSARNYFRRNMWGGSRLADALIEIGMGFDPGAYGQKPPEFPEPEDFGVEYKEWQDDAGEWQDGYIGERADEYKAAMNAVLDWHGVSDIPGIPVHKVCSSNDGWHVTKLECQAALGLYEAAIAAGKEHPDVFGDDFLPFLRAAALADGFEVH